MQFVDLEMDTVREPEIAHAYLREKLNLPEHYGCNLDALYDCLTEISEETVANLFFSDNEPTLFQQGVLSVFQDAARENGFLQLFAFYPEENEESK